MYLARIENMPLNPTRIGNAGLSSGVLKDGFEIEIHDMATRSL